MARQRVTVDRYGTRNKYNSSTLASAYDTSMTKSYDEGETVQWKWGNSSASGKVEKVSPKKTEIQSNGSTITRNGSENDPAVIIKQDDGSKVIKLASELK